jgi:hypothetical protein
MSLLVKPTSPLRRLAGVLLLGAAVSISAGCAVYGYDGDYPPDAYIATTSPVYFEGRPTYYYGGRWYYRDGHRWAHYNREPPGLYQRRLQAPPARRNYDSWRGNPPRRAGPGGGWRGNPQGGGGPARGAGWRDRP